MTGELTEYLRVGNIFNDQGRVIGNKLDGDVSLETIAQAAFVVCPACFGSFRQTFETETLTIGTTCCTVCYGSGQYPPRMRIGEFCAGADDETAGMFTVGWFFNDDEFFGAIRSELADQGYDDEEIEACIADSRVKRIWWRDEPNPATTEDARSTQDEEEPDIIFAECDYRQHGSYPVTVARWN